MESTLTSYFDGVKVLFAQEFENAIVTRYDDGLNRSLLEIWGDFGSYRVRLLEVVTHELTRKYAYYVFEDDEIIVGFDNAPDPHALRLKYGETYTAHRLERIPHCHTEKKTQIKLTDEMRCSDFVVWVKTNLPA